MTTIFTVCYATRSGTHAGMFRVVFIGEAGVSLTLDGITPGQVREFCDFDPLGQPRPSMTRFVIEPLPIEPIPSPS